MAFTTFLQGIDIRRSWRIFTLQIILDKIKPKNAAIYALSLITWTYHSKKANNWWTYDQVQGVLQRDNIWKWNQSNGDLNGGLDMLAQMAICMNLIYI